MENDLIIEIIRIIWNSLLILACIYLGNDVLDFGLLKKKTKFKYPLRLTIVLLAMMATIQNIFALKSISNPIIDIVKEFLVICALALIFFNCKHQNYGRD